MEFRANGKRVSLLAAIAVLASTAFALAQERPAPLTFIVTSDIGPHDVRSGVTRVVEAVANIAPAAVRGDVKVQGDLAFWTESERLSLLPGSSVWGELERRDPQLVCAFASDRARCDAGRRAGEFYLPRLQIVPIPTTRVVTVSGLKISSRTGDIATDLKRSICQVHVGWNFYATSDQSVDDCFVRVVPQAGGPYGHGRVCDNTKLKPNTKCPPENIVWEIVLRVTSFAVVIDGPLEKRERQRLVAAVQDLNIKRTPKSSFYGRVAVYDEAPGGQNLHQAGDGHNQCIAAELYDKVGSTEEWTRLRQQITFPNPPPSTRSGRTALIILDQNYDAQCKSVDASRWSREKCAVETQALKAHPFLSGQPVSRYQPDGCQGPRPSFDHSVSVAGLVAGGIAAATGGILSVGDLSHARTRFADTKAYAYPYMGTIPITAPLADRFLWLLPLQITSGFAEAKFADLLGVTVGNGRLYKGDNNLVFASVPHDSAGQCPENASSVDWSVDLATARCRCMPACLGRIDAGIVVAPLSKAGKPLRLTPDGANYLLGPGIAQIAAPADGLITPSFAEDAPVFRYRSGSSLAAAVAASAAGLYWHHDRDADPLAVMARLFSTADIDDLELVDVVRFGKLNLTRLMLPTINPIDAEEELLVQRPTSNQEAADARLPVERVKFDFETGLSTATEKIRLCQMEEGSAYLILVKNLTTGSDPVCVPLNRMLRLRMTVDGSGNPVASAVFWNGRGVYPAVRILRNRYLYGCSIAPQMAQGDRPACLSRKADKDPVGLDIRDADILFPISFSYR